MHIGVNLAYLRPSAVGGSEVYVRELVPRLARSGYKITVFCWTGAAATFEAAGVQAVTLARGRFSQPKRLVAENLRLAPLVRSRRLDVLFSPANFCAPLLPSGVPQVATFHDLQHVHLPEHFSIVQRVFRETLFRATARRCRALIAISEFTRNDAMREYRIDGGRIVTVLEGVTAAAPPTTAERDAVRARYGLPDRYFYYPAMLAPHKNHGLLLDALVALRARVGADVCLVLTGARTERYGTFLNDVRARGLGEAVMHLGFLPREHVLPVMAGAVALTFPSRFEGFGLPILEAMHCGVPVIASNSTSIPEVAGEAAILLPPDDVPAWARAMESVMEPEARVSLVQKGHANVTRFSWDRCAAETLDVLRRAAA